MCAAIIQKFRGELKLKSETLIAHLTDDGKCGDELLNKIMQPEMDEMNKRHAGVATAGKNLSSAVHSLCSAGSDRAQESHEVLRNTDALRLRARAFATKWSATTLVRKIKASPSKSLYDRLRELCEVHMDAAVKKHMDDKLLDDIKHALHDSKDMYSLYI